MNPPPTAKRGMKKPPVEKGRWASKGTKPLPDQATISHILSLFVVHLCRRILLVDTDVKLMVYSLGLFFGSLLFDFLTLPRSYLSYKDNIFNMYFVKLGWAWTILIVGAFVFMTSMTYGCGRPEVVKRHVTRLIIGTGLWLFWSQWFFYYIEEKTGVCLGRGIIKEKRMCTVNGSQWHAFDISGHAFLLVYMNLLILEEAKAITGWEGIRDLIRSEDHNRNNMFASDTTTSLKSLNEREFQILKDNYDMYTPYIRAVFICMTFLSLMSDVMLTCTILYFHTMPQKVAGGGIAITSYLITYRFWYKSDASPGLPGSGLFKYQHLKEKTNETPLRRSSSLCKEHSSKEVPMFMGMPIRGLKKDQDDKRKEEEDDTDKLPTKSKYGADTRNRKWER